MTNHKLWKRVATVSLALLAAGWLWLALADGNKTLSVKVVQEKKFQVAFPVDYSSGHIPIRSMQFTDMDWNAKTNEIAAGIEQGPWVPIVNVDTGHTRVIRTGERGGDRKVAWVPDSAQLMTVGSLLKTTDWLTNLQVYDTQGDMASPALTPHQNRADFLKGITLPDGRKAVLSFGEPRVDWIEDGKYRYKNNVKNFIYIHEAPNWEAGNALTFFPQDGKTYYANQVDVKQVGKDVLVAVVGLKQAGGPPIHNDYLTWVVNITSGKTLCTAQTYPDPGGNNLDQDSSGEWVNPAQSEAVALSNSGQWLAVRTGKHLEVIDVASCSRSQRLWTHPKIGIGAGFRKNMAFTPDEKYLVTIGSDVRSRHGGYLNVWRIPDGKHIHQADIRNPTSMAADPRLRRFAIESSEGELTLYRIKD
jgi:WD40 repeat protein